VIVITLADQRQYQGYVSWIDSSSAWSMLSSTIFAGNLHFVACSLEMPNLFAADNHPPALSQAAQVRGCHHLLLWHPRSSGLMTVS
jgi:hypothetical protein